MAKSRSIPREREWIEYLRSHSKSSAGVKLGIGDDCAILAPPRGHEILVTTDFTLETIHFRRDWHPPESVGHRCLTRGLSDLAAMGATPLAVFLSLALPVELLQSWRGKLSWRDRFFSGFLSLANKYRVPLAGGDTAQSPRSLLTPAGKSSRAGGLALADVVLIGSAPRGRAIRRSGASIGDRIYVTGQLGGAAAELAQLGAAPRRFRGCTVSGAAGTHPHLFPEPRLKIGAWLLKNRHVTAAIDISDGLSTDLDHLCQESGLSATIEAATLPVHPLAQTCTPEERLNLVLHGGEDYELLFTASPQARIPRRIAGVPVTAIGEMHPRRSGQLRVLLAEEWNSRRCERPLPPAGWEHYR
ncbi:MAG: thiamine-phosphate kinase [Acidobacteriaceae bacterium]